MCVHTRQLKITELIYLYNYWVWFTLQIKLKTGSLIQFKFDKSLYWAKYGTATILFIVCMKDGKRKLMIR